MEKKTTAAWQKKVVLPEEVLKRIEPGMSIFLGTGLAEPRTLAKYLMATDATNLQDLELIQVVSLGDLISIKEIQAHKYRLKTFFSGGLASKAITAGRVDLIPSMFFRIPRLIESGQISIDVAFVQITPPNEAGYTSLGVAVDLARQAMDQASLVVGEINPHIPRTFGDTFVPIDDFDFLVSAAEPPLYINRWPRDKIFDQVAENIASVIDDASTLAFSLGPLYEALSRKLTGKRHLGIHSPFITDALMDLIKSGAVSNRYKETFRGHSVTSYAIGTSELFAWLDENPLVEFQGIDKVFDPLRIGQNPGFVTVIPARKVDLTGIVALHSGEGNVAVGRGEVSAFFLGAKISDGGRVVFALPSRNRQGEPNIIMSAETDPNVMSMRESLDMIITEYGIANLSGRSVRERAQALIEVAHPDDRTQLIEAAKAQKILYPDQIFIAESAYLYPSEISAKETLTGGITVYFRAIKPSDEEAMRRLFYRFSDEAVYYRYFTAVKTMPHAKMQEYVNIDYCRTMSVVGILREAGQERIIAEARYVKHSQNSYADIAFVIDEDYQGVGLASCLYKMLIRLARERGLQGFTADILATNKGMMKVLEKGGLPMRAILDSGVYHVTIPFNGPTVSAGAKIQYEYRR